MPDAADPAPPAPGAVDLERLVDEEARAAPLAPASSLEALPEVDLATVCAEIVSLRAAVRAETEASRALRAALEQTLSSLGDRAERAEARARRAGEELAALRREIDRRVGLAIIDFVDRLEAARGAVRAVDPPAPVSPWRLRLAERLLGATAPGAALGALASGLELTLERLAARLAELGVEPVAALGRPFDPGTMRAAGVVSDGPGAEGEVMEVITPGYRDRDGVLRLAEVLVRKRA